MKHGFILALFLLFSTSVFAQNIMVLSQKDGTRVYKILSSIDSVKFMPDTTRIGPGSFTAGSTVVTMSGFSMDKFEVTYELYTSVRTWALSNGYTGMTAGQNGFNPVVMDNPVTNVNWYDAVKWCNARSEKAGLTPAYYTDADQTSVYRTGNVDINNVNVKLSANGYRLPTEAEWEYAAKGGPLAQSTPYKFSGSDISGDVAWYMDNSGNATHTVGLKAPNELGIFDMSGNVSEWGWDWFNSGTYPSGTVDPKGPDGTLSSRILRGGSFSGDGLYDCRSAERKGFPPSSRDYRYGFRCVRN